MISLVVPAFTMLRDSQAMTKKGKSGRTRGYHELRDGAEIPGKAK